MRNHSFAALAVAALVAGVHLPSSAADDGRVDMGKQEFQGKCATCHGLDGKGRGPLAAYLKVEPADLTVLSKRNGGVFPYLHVEAMIDGRDIVALHGERNMPVWGSDYLLETDRARVSSPSAPPDMEHYAHLRIVALIDYLNRIQVR